ncbi:MAG: hypothetical protein ACI9OS_002071 [Ulvibacter sp.]|jgi:hypothetical protein
MAKTALTVLLRFRLLSDVFVLSIAEIKLIIYNSLVDEEIYFIGKKNSQI